MNACPEPLDVRDRPLVGARLAMAEPAHQGEHRMNVSPEPLDVKPDPAYEEVAYPPLIDITRRWEVNCDQCGVIDAVRTKVKARRIAKRHAVRHEDGR